MTQQTKHIEVVPYNPQWPTMFGEEAAFLKSALGKNCIEIHHIGSTSVPHLSAKQDLDILCIVDSLPQSLSLEKHGYVFKGEFNIPLRNFFSKNTSHSKVNLHVVEPNHGFITLNLMFRDYLRNHEKTRYAYENLKKTLLQDPSSFQRVDGKWARYTLEKNVFIKNVLEKAGFSGISLNFCTHYQEWEAYHRIKEEQIFKPMEVLYNPHHPSLRADNHYHLVLYKGIHIVSIAHVEVLDNKEAILKSLVSDPVHKEEDFETIMIKQLENWVHSRQWILRIPERSPLKP